MRTWKRRHTQRAMHAHQYGTLKAPRLYMLATAEMNHVCHEPAQQLTARPATGKAGIQQPASICRVAKRRMMISVRSEKAGMQEE